MLYVAVLKSYISYYGSFQSCVSHFSLAGKAYCAFERDGNINFPWQEKLFAPLITNLIGCLQCKDRVKKSEGKKTATGYISIRLHKDVFFFCKKLDEVLIQITLSRINEFKEGKMKDWQELSLFCLLSSLKLPVVWLDFLTKLAQGVVGGGRIFVESWYFGRCYNDSCIGEGLIKRQ